VSAQTSSTPPTTDEQAQPRRSILEVIRSPLNLLALVTLVVEGVLVTITLRLENEDYRFYLAIAMVGVLVLLTTVAFFHLRSGGGRSASAGGPPRPRCGFADEPLTIDVFVAAPMAAHDDAQVYEKSRAEVMRVVTALRAHTRGFVFFAGEGLASKAQFDKLATVASDDLRRVAASRRVLLTSLVPKLSSVLVEVGVALCLGRPTLCCVRRSTDLPFLLQHAIKDKGIPASALEVETLDDLVAEIQRSGMAIFEAIPQTQ